MKLILVRSLAMLCLSVTLMCLFASTAWAQTVAFPAVAPATIPLPIVVVGFLSLLLGAINQAVQTGKILGRVVTPQAWLPWFTAIATVLGGVVSYLASQPTLTLNGSTLLFATMVGLANLVGSSMPGLAVHALHVVPQNVLALRAARLAAKAPPAPPGYAEV